ncbi:MAG: hypothetical protein NVS1B10_03270 [Candidatus Saccharimonadales bacterium]
MSLYKDYIKELYGRHILETDDGFMTYSFFGEECYIQDMYVVPQKRQSRVASDLADKIAELAKDHGCKYLTGTVFLSNNEPTRSLKVLLGYGFKLLRSEVDKIVLVKELS